MAPQTRAERTHYQETSSHRDVMEFLSQVRGAQCHVTEFGQSAQGRTLPLAVLSAHGVKTPEEARQRNLPVVFILNCIHAGEVEGKEATLMLLRDLAQSPLLAELTLVIAPIYNADGNDAFSDQNRKLALEKLEGQCGPLLVGTRVNASGINLNRDYLKQSAVESRHLAALMQRWQPELTIDTHATNGSVHRLAMTYDVPHTVESGRAEPIAFMRERVLPVVTRALATQHQVSAGWYGNFVEDERALDARTQVNAAEPVREGWMTYTHHPRFGSNYRGLSNRLDLLLECYSYQSFEARTRATYATLLETLQYVAAHRDDVMQVVAASRTPREKIAVRYRLEPFETPIEIPTCSPRTLQGAPTVVKVPHFARFVGSTVVQRPSAYLVPAQVAEHLARHGLASELPSGKLECEVATVEGFGTEGGRKILEAATVGDLHVTWTRSRREALPGMRLVRTGGPAGAVAVYLCEPESDDGAVENGLVAPPELGGEFPIWRVPELPR